MAVWLKTLPKKVMCVLKFKTQTSDPIQRNVWIRFGNAPLTVSFSFIFNNWICRWMQRHVGSWHLITPAGKFIVHPAHTQVVPFIFKTVINGELVPRVAEQEHGTLELIGWVFVFYWASPSTSSIVIVNPKKTALHHHHQFARAYVVCVSLFNVRVARSVYGMDKWADKPARWWRCTTTTFDPISYTLSLPH